MINVLLGFGCFCVGVVVGIVLDDAWDLLRESRRDAHMKPGLPRVRLRQVLLALLGVAFVANVALGIHLATTRASDRENAVVTCKNGNESREAQRSLWDVILRLSAANREDEPTQREQEQLEAFRAWIADLFAERDCSDLSRKYPIPLPPTIAD